MLVLFTSNINGGILQFIVQVLTELKKLNYKVLAFIPETAEYSLSSLYEDNVRTYNKVKSINVRDSRIKELSNQVLSYNPELVWYFDNGVLCSEMALTLENRVCQMLTMHDAGSIHPTTNEKINAKLHRAFEYTLSRRAEKNVNHILLLSEESKEKYLHIRPQYENKIRLLQLGAHIPEADELKPREKLPEKYIMFFGRIDKYKGLENLFRSYANYFGSMQLVVAGKGQLSNKEEKYIQSDDRIVLINRYIKDEEMLWLFSNSIALVLPYIEATQSGIIPIAYKYGKPVIVSNVKGLTQFVVHGKTGYICKNKEDYIKALNSLGDKKCQKMMGKSAKTYYEAKLDWKKNLIELFNSLSIQRS